MILLQLFLPEIHSTGSMLYGLMTHQEIGKFTINPVLMVEFHGLGLLA